MAQKKIIIVLLISTISCLLIGCDVLFPKELTFCEDPRVRLFLNQVFGIVDDIDFVVVEINDTLSKIEQNPLLLISSSFLDGLTEQVDFAFNITETALALAAPRIEFDVFIDLFKGSFNDFSNAIQFLNEGLAEQNALKMLTSIPTFLSGQEKMDDAIFEFNSVIEECVGLLPL